MNTGRTLWYRHTHNAPECLNSDLGIITHYPKIATKMGQYTHSIIKPCQTPNHVLACCRGSSYRTLAGHKEIRTHKRPYLSVAKMRSNSAANFEPKLVKLLLTLGIFASLNAVGLSQNKTWQPNMLSKRLSHNLWRVVTSLILWKTCVVNQW